ncbi:hypothetical protein P3S67_016595 [Capsicum chacoense]
MTRQKVVIKLYINGNDQKSRTKAFKIAVSQPGVLSAAIQRGGFENYYLEVVGEYIDAAILTNSVRKKLGQAQLVSLGPATPQASPAATQWPQQPYSYLGVPQHQVYEVTDPNPECCSIM